MFFYVNLKENSTNGKECLSFQQIETLPTKIEVLLYRKQINPNDLILIFDKLLDEEKINIRRENNGNSIERRRSNSKDSDIILYDKECCKTIIVLKNSFPYLTFERYMEIYKKTELTENNKTIFYLPNYDSDNVEFRLGVIIA